MIDRILVDRWRKAYKKIHDKQPPCVNHNHGWYSIDGVSGSFRRSDFLKMAERLEQEFKNKDSELIGLEVGDTQVMSD